MASSRLTAPCVLVVVLAVQVSELPGRWNEPAQKRVRVRVHHVIGEPGERDDRLDGRARRIGAAQRAIEQRPVDVALQRAVLGAR